MSDDHKHDKACTEHPFHDHTHDPSTKGSFGNTMRWGFNPGIEDFNPWTADIKEIVKSTDAYKRTVGGEENFDQKAADEVDECLDMFAEIIDSIRHVFDDPQAATHLRKHLKDLE